MRPTFPAPWRLPAPRPSWRLAAALAAGLLLACSGSRQQATPTASVTPPPGAVAVPTSTSDVDYTDAANWLCRPGKTASPCNADLDATIRSPDGSTSVERFSPASDPRVDCFYVYPTVSNDPGVNSDLIPGADETRAFVNQAARLASVCRVFAPVYRQATLTDLNQALANLRPRDPKSLDFAYQDVLKAFDDYLARDNQGRGFILVGHSQGSEHLIRLIKEQIDPNPQLRARLVAAYVIGAAVHVPPNADVGGDFRNVPACRATDQTGCVVAYSSFNASSPPPANSFFGRGGVLCVNPAALAGGPAALTPYFPTSAAFAAAGVSTPFLSPRGAVQGECVNEGGASYLKVTADPSVGIPATTGGPQWGLHILDVNLTMGDLVALAAKQAAAYVARAPR